MSTAEHDLAAPSFASLARILAMLKYPDHGRWIHYCCNVEGFYRLYRRAKRQLVLYHRPSLTRLSPSPVSPPSIFTSGLGCLTGLAGCSSFPQPALASALDWAPAFDLFTAKLREPCGRNVCACVCV